MMASIPNMRSTPLPLPGAKPGAAGEGAPGDFAAQMPAVPALPGAAAPVLTEVASGPIAPSLPSPLLLDLSQVAGDGAGADAPETKTVAKTETEAKSEAPEADPSVAAAVVVIPFLPAQPAVAPTLPAAIPAAAGEAVPVEPRKPQVAAAPAKPAPTASGPDVAQRGLPLPAVTDSSEGQAKSPEQPADVPQDGTDAAEIEVAVKQLLQRKAAPTKQVAMPARGKQPDSAKPVTAPAQAQAPAQPQPQPPEHSAPVAPVAPQAQAPGSTPGQPQPMPNPAAVPPAPLPAEPAATTEGTRTADLAVERQLDLARDNQWLDRLARDIARAASDDQPLRFRLHPQTLGHLQVELQQGDHGTAVRLTVETEAARQLLADAQPRLAAEARAQGVRIAETQVDLSGSGRHAPGDQRRQDEARQSPLIRTAPGAGRDAVASPRSSARARLDRYA